MRHLSRVHIAEHGIRMQAQQKRRAQQRKRVRSMGLAQARAILGNTTCEDVAGASKPTKVASLEQEAAGVPERPYDQVRMCACQLHSPPAPPQAAHAS